MAQPHNFKSGLMTIRDAEKLNELQKWIDNRRAALAIPSNEFNPAYKFQAKITAYSSDDYTWVRQAFDTDGEYIDDPVPYSGGPSDMPAKERNGLIGSVFPFYAELTFRVNVQGSPYYEFDLGASRVLRVLGRTGDISAVTKLTVNNAVLTGTASDAILTPDVATASLAGIVSTSDQTMGDGNKTFQETVTVNSKKQTGEFFRVWGVATADPLILTDDDEVFIGGNTNPADLTVSDALFVRGTAELYGDVNVNSDNTSGHGLTVGGLSGTVLETGNTGVTIDGGGVDGYYPASLTVNGTVQLNSCGLWSMGERTGGGSGDGPFIAIATTYGLGRQQIIIEPYNQSSVSDYANSIGIHTSADSRTDGSPMVGPILTFFPAGTDGYDPLIPYVGISDGAAFKVGVHPGISGTILYGGTSTGGIVTDPGSAITPGSITGFDESAQDAVGTILVDTATVNLTYTDGTPSITADVITGTSGASIPLLNGNNTYSGSANFTDAFYLSGDISPAQLTANTDNWNPTGW